MIETQQANRNATKGSHGKQGDGNDIQTQEHVEQVLTPDIRPREQRPRGEMSESTHDNQPGTGSADDPPQKKRRLVVPQFVSGLLSPQELEDSIIEQTTERSPHNASSHRIPNGVKLRSVESEDARLLKCTKDYLDYLKRGGKTVEPAEADPEKFSKSLKVGGVIAEINTNAKRNKIFFEQFVRRVEADFEWESKQGFDKDGSEYGLEEGGLEEDEEPMVETLDKNGDLGFELGSDTPE